MKHRTLVAVGLAGLLLVPAAVGAQATPDDILEQARSGRVEVALSAIDALLAEDPDHPRANLVRGVILAESGRTTEAARIFEGLIERYPELPEAYNNLAVIQAGDGNFDAAVNTLKGALATRESYQTAYENLTRIFAQLASEAYSRALEVDSPPTREEVQLVMLSDLEAIRSLAPPVEASRRLTPAEPLVATPQAPIAAAETSDEPRAEARLAEVGSEPVAEIAAPQPEPVSAPVAAVDVESEDLEIGEMESGDPVAASAALVENLEALIDDWARAWSEQRVDDYLSFYASEFVPAGGMAREEWAASRRQRLSVPEYIRVEVAILDAEAETEDRAKVTFLQAYESDTFSDEVTKTLALVWRETGWKIIGETVGS